MRAKKYLLLIPLFVYGCASVEQTTQTETGNKQDVYVFDDVSKLDTTKIIPEKNVVVKEEKPNVESNVTATSKKYVIQLGAFTSKDRAQSFISENQSKTSLPMGIEYNNLTKLFLVQLPPYKTKEEADLVRDNLRKFPAFKDAFTATMLK